MTRHRRSRTRLRGFTLIELLVAIAVMALLAIMSWRGLDGMARTQSQLKGRADAVLTLQATLSQWGADLDAAVPLASTLPIDWDGRALRITRRGSDGPAATVFVVAWTLRTDDTGTRWHRWQSAPVTTRGDWRLAWNQAAAWANNSAENAQGTDVALMPVQEWQIQYFRNGQWGPAQSSDATSGTASAPASTTTNALPDGIRLLLVLPPGPALSGTLTRDWVRPTLATAKS
ncbi:prepilin-type N-terminal cleavage/methylation domain-containing protein [Variovorax sp. J22R133]|uniref:prepilin-type N-terminal cleavage/methylation domain-containing protein n=1 Tax=Variovorax brevis TaxID=3053503 RepID=UPI0025763073|nr:prepilin-type N-terminal cleavage/methylation domain-containing protein [Variovorax sp. J22R133]MDM0114494.1 prepilin-type N-terminal cleavage/methylation domain-containing protein [Variovorax sp. J22R133]